MKHTKHTINQILEYSNKGYSSRQISLLVFGTKTKKSTVNNYLNSLRTEVPEAQQQGPKILAFDLETAAALVHCFGRHKQFIGQEGIVKEGGWIICGGYRWLNEDETRLTYDSQEVKQGTDEEVCRALWNLFNEADAVIGHNLKQFDLKVLETRCLANGLPPLPHVKLIDTLEIAKKKFRFPSNKLDSLGAYLGLGRKVGHSGMKMWKDVQEGNEEALNEVLVYCKQDVDLLIDVFRELSARGMVSSFNASLYFNDNVPRCHICGSDKIELTGRSVYTAASEFKETRCGSCNAVGRTRVNQLSSEKRKNLISSAIG